MRFFLIVILVFFVSLTNAQQFFNKNIFGFATSNTFTFFNVDDTVFQEKIGQISPRVLRFPGGAVGNFYHFNEPAYGLKLNEIDSLISGKFPKRARGLINFARKKGHRDNYIYDFMKLAKSTGASAVLVANVLTEDIDDIINMINTIQENDIDIIGVELGSELSNKSYYDNGYTIESYIARAEYISQQIKSDFPKLKTAVVAAPILKDKKHRHYLWNKKLSVLDFYDAIIVHSYAKVVKGKDQYGQMIEEKYEGNFSVAFEKYKKRVHEYFNTTYPREIANYNLIYNNTPIWITEWNLQYSKKTGNTHLQGLFVANYFLELISNPDFKTIELTTFHNLAGRDFGGSIFQMKDNRSLTQSTFYPIHLISSFFIEGRYKVINEIDDGVYKYSLINNNNEVVSKCWINWSDREYTPNLTENDFSVKSECFSSKLFSLNSEDNAIQYREGNYYPSSKLILKPYSITLVK
ncbi:MAG: hypothetical protein P8J77_02275 [Flavobacteriales bacterium]|nr:hypothetical protein [Flavobacteriales bacterium]